MGISSVYIVKNEEHNIEKSILSLKEVVDEIIVVDTGSTDKTKEICKKLGCKIYDYKWDNDFAKARNYALGLCNYDIAIFLDADEYFSPCLKLEDKETIEKCFTNKIDILGCYELDIEKTTKETHHDSYAYKIMKTNLFYKGKIHEYVTKSKGKIKACVIEGLQLIHTGYSQEISKLKIERNLEILNSLENKETMEYFYLGRENLSIGNYEESDKNLDLFFHQKDYKKIIKSNNLAYTAYLYKIMTMQQLQDKYSEPDILKFLKKAQKEIYFVPEIYFYLGVFYFSKNLDISLKYFEKCIKINEKFNNKYHFLNGFIGYQDRIYYYLAKIKSLKNNRNGAIQECIVACMLNKTSKENLGLLLTLLNKEKHTENTDLLNRIYRPNNKQDYEFLVSCLANTNHYITFLTFSMIYNQNYHGGSDDLYYAMMLNKDYDSALESLNKFDNEKSHFITTIILLFANNEELIKKYNPYLPDKYNRIMDYVLNNNYSRKLDTELLSQIVCKLSIYGKDFDFKTWVKFLAIFDEQQINNIVNILNIKENYILIKELLEYFIFVKDKYSDKIISQYLVGLYKLKLYEDFINYYNLVLKLLRKKDIQLGLLFEIKNTKLDKSFEKLNLKLIKEIKKYAKSK